MILQNEEFHYLLSLFMVVKSNQIISNQITVGYGN
jgi:hypothetical protein